MSPSTHSAPLQQQKHQNKAHATSAASQPPAAQQSCPGRRDRPTSPQTCSVATSSPTDSSDTHESYRKQFWGAESYSPGGSEYFLLVWVSAAQWAAQHTLALLCRTRWGCRARSKQGPRPIPRSQPAHQLSANVNPYRHFSRAVPAGTSFC